MKKIALLNLFLFVSVAFLHAQRLMENLDRGVAAARTAEGNVFVSWRLLGTEAAELSFNLYRIMNGKTEKLNKEPITKVTGFLDDLVDSSSGRTYFVRTVVKGKEGEKSREFHLQNG